MRQLIALLTAGFMMAMVGPVVAQDKAAKPSKLETRYQPTQRTATIHAPTKPLTALARPTTIESSQLTVATSPDLPCGPHP